MRKITKHTLLVASFVFGQLLFSSCHNPNNMEIICINDFTKASALAHSRPTRKSALDSSLTIINRCLQCDSIKLAVVDLKIRLLITLGKFEEGSKYIDSLQVSDFIYPYKKKLIYDNLIARNFGSDNDTFSQNKVLRQMTSDLERYIYSNNLKSKEFQEAFIDLTDIDSTVSYPHIDSLKVIYPNEVSFLEFFKH